MADDEKNPPCAIGGCREEQQQQQTEKKKKTRDEKVPGGGSEAGDAIRAGPDLVGDDGFNAGADQELGRAAAAAGGVVGEKTSSSLPFSKARCIALVATVTGAAFLNTLSAQCVVIILPTIGRDLGVPGARLQWIVSSYSLAFGCFLLLWGRVADIYGKRLIFVAGSVWVAAVTAVNPFVPDEVGFDVFRGLHGLGSAANVPTAIGILGVTFPPGKAKTYAFSTYAAGAPLGSICGNLLSGFVAQFASWKWVFGALAIMAAIISVAGFVLIPAPPRSSGSSSSPGPSSSPSSSSPPSSPASVDWVGAALVTAGLIMLMFALTEGNVVGWATPWIAALLVLSVLVIAVFVAWQRHLERATTRRPLVKVSMFAKVRFSAAMIIMALSFASFNNYLIVATYFYQGYQGLSPLQTTLRFVPTGVGGATVAVIVAQLLGRVPTFYIILCGHVALVLASLIFALPIGPGTSYFAWGLPAMLLSVVGVDTLWGSLTLFTSQALPPEDQALGGALVNAVGQVGRAVGLAVGTAVQTAVMASARHVPISHSGGVEQSDPASLRGLRASSWFNFALALASTAVVLLAFRGNQIIGRADPKTIERSGGEEGIMNEEDTGATARR